MDPVRMLLGLGSLHTCGVVRNRRTQRGHTEVVQGVVTQPCSSLAAIRGFKGIADLKAVRACKGGTSGRSCE